MRLGNEVRLAHGISLGQPPHSPFPKHRHRLDTLQGSPSALKRAIALGQPDPLLYRAMILFHYVVKVLTLTQANPPRERTLGLLPRYGSRLCGVLINVHDSWQGIAACCRSLTEEPFGGCGISFGREQKVDRPPQGVDYTIQILVFAFDLYIGLVDPIALVRELEMRSAPPIQLRRIGLRPAPNATGIHLDATLRQNLGDVLD